MKKIIEKIIPAKEESVKKTEVIYCDICGEPDPGNSVYKQMTKCLLCDRDIHRYCNTKCSFSDPDEWGDYPDHYCSICYELRFTKYKKDWSDIEEDYEERQEKLTQKIKEESLNL